jgi:hypothetical protein
MKAGIGALDAGMSIARTDASYRWPARSTHMMIAFPFGCGHRMGRLKDPAWIS